MATFYFTGHETVGDYVRDCLEEADCFEVLDPAEAGVCLTYFTSEADVETAYLDSDGFFQVAQQDALLVDLSATSPGFARELSALSQVSGLKFVEAPLALRDITRADAFGARENVTCCAAGTEDALAAARPLLDVLFSQVHACGPAGSAQRAHAAFAMQRAALIMAGAEAFALYQDGAADAFGDACAGQGCGCDAPVAKCPPALTDESAVILKAMCEKRFRGSFTIEMLRGDLDAALRAAEDAGQTFPILEGCEHMLELLEVAGASDLDPAAVVLAFSSDEEGAPFGIDWKRAESFAFHDHEHDDDDDDDDDDYDDDFDDGDGGPFGMDFDFDGLDHGDIGHLIDRAGSRFHP